MIENNSTLGIEEFDFVSQNPHDSYTWQFLIGGDLHISKYWIEIGMTDNPEQMTVRVLYCLEGRFNVFHVAPD